MKQLTHRQYDALEAAVTHSRRVSVYRRGTEYVGIPQRIWQDGQREAVSILQYGHPVRLFGTGEDLGLTGRLRQDTGTEDEYQGRCHRVKVDVSA